MIPMILGIMIMTGGFIVFIGGIAIWLTLILNDSN